MKSLTAILISTAPFVCVVATAQKTFPANNATRVNPDTHLVLTFESAPTIGKSGLVRIYDASDRQLVDTLDLGIPAGPDPSRRIQPPPATAIDPLPATPTTTTPAVRTAPADLHNYQLNTIGGLADFHFFPIIVHGNIATIYPHNNVLKYHHRYQVEIDPGLLTPASGSFAGFDARRRWVFTTKPAPPSAGDTRLVVAADGTGDFNTVQGAVDFVPAEPSRRITIFVRNGKYEEIVFFQKKANITFLGEDRDKVEIGYGNNSAFNPPMPGPSRRCAFSAYDSTGIEIRNLTLSNYLTGQAEALLVFGSKNIVDHVTMSGSGDALNLRGSVYIADSIIAGHGDTILGVGPAFFIRCVIKSAGPFMWIRNTEANHGNVFVDSTFIAVNRPLPGTVNAPNAAPVIAPKVLARLPNNHGLNYPYAEAVLIRCKLSGVSPEGWGPIDGDNTHIRFMEFASTDPEGKPIDISQRHPTSKQLTMPADARAIADYSRPAFVLDGWNPQP